MSFLFFTASNNFLNFGIIFLIPKNDFVVVVVVVLRLLLCKRPLTLLLISLAFPPLDTSPSGCCSPCEDIRGSTAFKLPKLPPPKCLLIDSEAQGPPPRPLALLQKWVPSAPKRPGSQGLQGRYETASREK